MKVKELREQLQNLDGNAEVKLRCDDAEDNYYLSIRERFDYIIKLEQANEN
tara:strand:- start:196 stop:348 length:153 start_codon:yes stop_codon:yes gene_type:complete